MRLLVIVALLGVAGPAAAAQPDRGPGVCSLSLPAGAMGGQAIAVLGDRLPEVASLNAVSVEVLRSRLAADRTLGVDPCGRLFYVDEGTPAGITTAESGTALATMPFPSGDTFLLHSRPGGTRVIFLDFDGETLSGTSWNGYFHLASTYSVTGYDTDGSPATFSDAERSIIQSVWERVAEDYAPFDVDVTTQDPGVSGIERSGSGDTTFGTKALITNDAGMQATCGCGGIAYVGVYDMSSMHQYYQPALVFQRALGGGTVAKYLAEATSHEVGHNLGLAHDGTPTSGYYTGQGSWAPIMGVGYYQPIVQWSKGEYSAANNTEDDFAVMQANGAPLRADDYSDTRSSASPLGSGATVTANGRIGTRADMDWFSFTGSGATTITLAPAPTSPNLDIRVELYDSQGTLVLAADPAATTLNYDQAAGLGAMISVNIPTTGTYFFKVDGMGVGDPVTTGYSDYASLGTYTATVTTQASTGLAVATTSLPAGTNGVPYTADLAATGGTAPYTWALDGSFGPLPVGLTLSTSGVISGTPAADGTYPIAVVLTDSASATATKSLSIAVAAQLSITTGSLPAGTVGVAYSAALAAAGGSGSYTWSLASGSLAPGLALSTSTGSISGTPTSVGDSSFSVRATDGAGRTATAALGISVASPPTLTTVLAYDGTTATKPNASTTLSATLRTTGGMAIAGRLVTFALNGSTYSATTNSLGVASKSARAPVTAGTYLISVTFAGDPTYAPATATASLADRDTTSLAYTGAKSAATGSPVTLSATLKTSSGALLAGRTVTFTLNGSSTSVTTDSSGVAVSTVSAPASAGSFPIGVSFAGDPVAAASSASSTLAVKLATVVTYTGPTSAARGASITLSASLATTGGTPIAGKTVKFTLNGRNTNATTNASGIASANVTAPTTAGAYAVISAFGGDSTSAAASAVGSVTVS